MKEDLAVFEERRLQDVLLSRVQAPSFSVKDVDFSSLWEHRLSELLDKRQLYQEVTMCFRCVLIRSRFMIAMVNSVHTYHRFSSYPKGISSL